MPLTPTSTNNGIVLTDVATAITPILSPKNCEASSVFPPSMGCGYPNEISEKRFNWGQRIYRQIDG
jgi:hypothetical protein